MEKRKIDFDTPEWQEYFKGKSSEEIEKIKKLFEEKKEIPRRSSGSVEKICPECGGTGKKITPSGEEEICPGCQGRGYREVTSEEKKKKDKEMTIVIMSILLSFIAICVVFSPSSPSYQSSKKSSSVSHPILMEGRTYTINQDDIAVFDTKDIPITKTEMLNHLVTVLVKGDKIELSKSGFLVSKVVVREHNGQPVYWYGWIPTGLLSKSVK